jgi:hypothetical protein
VLWIRDILANPCLLTMDPDLAPDPAPCPAISVIDLQDNNKNYFFCFSAYHFLKVHLNNFSEIKSHKEVTKK